MALEVIQGHGVGQIKIDPAQLEQVLLNLAVNARDAMAGKGRVTIGVRAADVTRRADGTGEEPLEPGRYVVVSVADTGVGMDKATLARIFEPFFTTKSRAQGTGLGLSIVHGIVRQCGGHVAVESEPGVGSTFHLYFPATEEAITPTPSVADAQRPRGQ